MAAQLALVCAALAPLTLGARAARAAVYLQYFETSYQEILAFFGAAP